MPRRPWTRQNIVPDISPTTLTTTAETVVATVSGVTTDSPDANVILEGAVEVTPGTSTTALVVKVKRGTTTGGTQVGKTVTQSVTAPNPGSVGIQVSDIPGEGAFSYVVTVAQTGAAANGTVDAATLTATF